MTDLTGASLTWRGVMFAGSRSGGRFSIATLEGWEDWDSSRSAPARPAAHGAMGSAPLSEGKVIRASGLCRNAAERDAMLAELGDTFRLADAGARAEDLTIDLAGRELTARCFVTRYKAPLDLWSAGLFSWAVEWVTDDPLRYGARVPATTGFPVAAGGLRWPLYSDGAGVNVGALDYGPASTTGRLILANPGTAAASIQHEVIGPVDASGFEVIQINGPGRLVFEGPVPAGSTLLLDGASGAVLMDGYADRGDVLTSRVWPVAPRLGSVELFFRPRGSTSAASLTSSLAPAYW